MKMLEFAVVQFYELLKAQGIETVCLGFSYNDALLSGEGFVGVKGSHPIVLNLLCGMVAKLRPEDFANLLTALMTHPMFEPHRTGAGIKAEIAVEKDKGPAAPPAAPAKKNWMN